METRSIRAIVQAKKIPILIVSGIVVALAAALVLILVLVGPSESQDAKQLARYWKQFTEITARMDQYYPYMKDLKTVEPGADLNRFYDDTERSIDELVALEKTVSGSKPESIGDLAAWTYLKSVMLPYAGYLARLRDFQRCYTHGYWDVIDSDRILSMMTENAPKVEDATKGFQARVPSARESSLNSDLLKLASTYGQQLASLEKDPEMTQKRKSRKNTYLNVDAYLDSVVLPAYRSGGYGAIAQYMTPELKQRLASQIASGGATGIRYTAIMAFRFTDKNKIVFSVRETFQDGRTNRYERFELVDMGGNWLVCDIEPGSLAQ